MKLLRKIGFLFVPLYYVVTWLRNLLYDIGVFKSVHYDFPVIAVGNLSVGGTGKTPMIECLIRMLEGNLRLATLSRGYKREKKGFQFVTTDVIAREVGDEPLQLKKKFPQVIVAVDADRRNGIEQIRMITPQPEVILLDDAYQHRRVKAGLYVLLTSYYKLYPDDMLLPTGDLREPIKGAERAAIVVVTKCPSGLTLSDRERIRKRLKLSGEQSLYFSAIHYEESLHNGKEYRDLDTLKGTFFTLVTGVANPKPLLEYYRSKDLVFEHLNYPDHHLFSANEIETLEQLPLIVTTEKDYIRLSPYLSINKLWYQPIKMKFIVGEESFDKEIKSFVQPFYKKEDK